MVRLISACPRTPERLVVQLTRIARDRAGRLVMHFQPLDPFGCPQGPEHGPSPPIVSVEPVRQPGGALIARHTEVLFKIGTESGSLYPMYLTREQANLISILARRANEAVQHRRRSPKVVLEAALTSPRVR